MDKENKADDIMDNGAYSSPEYPQGFKLATLLLSIYLSIFLVALDRTIIATAIPQITNHFQSFDDIGWYNAAFLMPTTALQLFFGRVYTFYSPKWVYFYLVILFEIGSAICGSAQSSGLFIFGRAVAGLAAGGLQNGGLILIMYSAPLNRQAIYLGLLGAVFGVASVSGPLLGGVFVSKISWRWCFYINLPIGVAVLGFLYFAFEDVPAVLAKLSFREKVARLDIFGTIMFVPCMICFLLALQWGGQQYAWSDRRIIVLLLLSGAFFIVFMLLQVLQDEKSITVPPRLIKQRTIAAGTWYSFTLGSAFMIIVYYLSIWFQTVKGDSALTSGYSTVPFLLSVVISSTISGILISKTGYCNPFIITGAVLAPIGAGLFTIFQPTTAYPMCIGVEVVFGVGVGLGLQQATIAAQTVLDKEDAPTGISIVYFGQRLGGTISVAIGQSILDNQLIKGLSQISGSSVDPYSIVKIGQTDIGKVFDAQELPDVLNVYNEAIILVFYSAVGFSVAAAFGAFVLEWKSVKKTRTRDEPN